MSNRLICVVFLARSNDVFALQGLKVFVAEIIIKAFGITVSKMLRIFHSKKYFFVGVILIFLMLLSYFSPLLCTSFWFTPSFYSIVPFFIAIF